MANAGGQRLDKNNINNNGLNGGISVSVSVNNSISGSVIGSISGSISGSRGGAFSPSPKGGYRAATGGMKEVAWPIRVEEQRGSTAERQRLLTKASQVMVMVITIAKYPDSNTLTHPLTDTSRTHFINTH